jgi:hypothetical protein
VGLVLGGGDRSGTDCRDRAHARRRPAKDVSLLLAKLQAFPLVLRTLYSYHWNLSLGQVAESTSTLNISYFSATGE